MSQEFPKPIADRRQGNSSEESNISNESTDADLQGFCFHQVGILEAFKPDKEYCIDSRAELESQRQAEERDDLQEEYAWTPTKHVVVVRINAGGKPTGVYIICNMFPRSPHTGEKTRVRTSGFDWGRLPMDSKRYAIAKMADSIQHLGWGYDIRWSEGESRPVKLV